MVAVLVGESLRVGGTARWRPEWFKTPLEGLDGRWKGLQTSVDLGTRCLVRVQVVRSKACRRVTTAIPELSVYEIRCEQQ